jgi:hypothetical protein
MKNTTDQALDLLDQINFDGKGANVIYKEREDFNKKQVADAQGANVILNTKHYKTKVCKTQDVLLSGLRHHPLGETSSPTQEVASSEASGLVEQATPQPIHYLSASVKQNTKETTRTRTINVDFRLENSTNTNFNKITFSMSDRRRDFLNNTPPEWWMDFEYEQAQLYYDESLKDVAKDQKWIGKGRERPRYRKGKFVNTELKQGLTAVLSYHKNYNCYDLLLWIEGIKYQLRLLPTDNERYPYRTDSVLTEKITYKPRGGWL